MLRSKDPFKMGSGIISVGCGVVVSKNEACGDCTAIHTPNQARIVLQTIMVRRGTKHSKDLDHGLQNSSILQYFRM